MEHTCDQVEIPLCLLMQLYDMLDDCHRLFEELGDTPTARWIEISLDELEIIRRRYAGEIPHGTSVVHH